jgi:hypothetical protein
MSTEIEKSSSLNTDSKSTSSKFASLLENKELIIVAVQVCLLLAICYYFYNKNTKIMKYLEEITAKIENLEDLIESNDKKAQDQIYYLQDQIAQQSKKVSFQPTPQQPTQQPLQPQQYVPKEQPVQKQPVQIKKVSPSSIPPPVQKPVKIAEQIIVEEKVDFEIQSGSVTGVDLDLDQILEQELSDLSNNNEEVGIKSID